MIASSTTEQYSENCLRESRNYGDSWSTANNSGDFVYSSSVIRLLGVSKFENILLECGLI